MSHSWPFNIKELQSACARVAIEADAARLAEAAALGLSLPAAAELAGASRPTATTAPTAAAAAAIGATAPAASSTCGCSKAASGACSGPGASGKGACGGTACKCIGASAATETAQAGPAAAAAADVFAEELEEAGPIGDDLLTFLQQVRGRWAGWGGGGGGAVRDPTTSLHGMHAQSSMPPVVSKLAVPPGAGRGSPAGR